MRQLAMAMTVAGLALASAATANPLQGSDQYQRAIRCAGLATAAMVYAVEVETTGETLEHGGKSVSFAAPETYQESGNGWLRAAIGMGEFEEPTVRRDLDDEAQRIGAEVDKSSDKARELVKVLDEFEKCSR